MISPSEVHGVRSFLGVFTGMMFAQGGATGAIGGVQDGQAAIADAKVSVKNEATGEVLRQ